MRIPCPCWLLHLCLLLMLGGCAAEEPALRVSSWVEPPGSPPPISRIAALPEAGWASHRGAGNRGYTDRPVWFRVEVRPPAPADWVVEFANPVLDHLDVYLPGAGRDEWVTLHLGDKFPFAQRPIASRNFAVPLPAAGDRPLTLYVRVRSSSSVQLPARLVTREALLIADQRMLLLDTGLVGLLSGLFLYNLLLLYRIRETLYVYYTVWLFLISIFVFSLNGTAFQYWWPESTTWNDSVLVLTLLSSIIILVAFWLRALAEFVGRERVPRDAIVISALLSGNTLALMLPYRFAIQITIVFTLACALGLATLGWLASRRDTPGARGLLWSFIPLLCGGYLLAVERFGLIEHSVVTQYAIAVGCALQAIMLSALMADRMVRLREAHAAAGQLQRVNSELADANSDLEASNSALQEALDTAESRARAISDMKESLRQAAEERNRDKSKFLAQAVHDLKQPLQAISLALVPLKGSLGDSCPGAQEELIDLIQRATGVMRTQISSLLDLSRLESGVVQAQLEVFDLAPFIDQTLDPLLAVAAQKDVRIDRARHPSDAVYARSDPALLRQVLLNLVGNAIKYSDAAKAPDCWVRITHTRVGDAVRIDIRDNGLGIEAQHLASRAIFQPFFQAHNMQPEAEKGVGLGLSIVNAVLALLPDHCLAVSSDFGLGTCFSLSLPAESLPSGLAATAGAVADETVDDIAGAFVLLVEDDVLVRQSIGILLDSCAVRYQAFASVEDLARGLPGIERRPDVLLTDYRLPDDRTAHDVMALLASAWDMVPVLVLTGDAVAAEAFERAGGIAGVLRKPVAPADLLKHLATLYRRDP